MKLWCLNVGSAVTAWETLEDAAADRIELVALQEVKLNTTEFKSFDTRAAALGYACFGVPADYQDEGRTRARGESSFLSASYTNQDRQRSSRVVEVKQARYG